MPRKMLKDIEWPTRDGNGNLKKIKVIEMDDKHIQNCINMFTRNMPKYPDRTKKTAEKWLKIFNAELKRRERLKASQIDLSEELIDEFRDLQEETDHYLYEEYK
jgi:hypothetical protein